jgi:hypothetical protein
MKPEPSDSTEGRLKEYELLRQELLQYDQSILQIVGIVIGLIGVVTAQGLTSGNPWIFVVPLPVLIVLSTYVSDKRWIIWLIASYISEFIEKQDLGPQWETRLYWFRTACRHKKGFMPGQNVIRIECLLFNLLGLMEFVLFAHFGWSKQIPYWHYLVPLAFLVWLAVQTLTSYCRLVHEGGEGGTLSQLWAEGRRLKESSRPDVEP